MHPPGSVAKSGGAHPWHEPAGVDVDRHRPRVARQEPDRAALRQPVEPRVVAAAGDVGIADVEHAAHPGRRGLGERRAQRRFDHEVAPRNDRNGAVEQPSTGRKVRRLPRSLLRDRTAALDPVAELAEQLLGTAPSPASSRDRTDPSSGGSGSASRRDPCRRAPHRRRRGTRIPTSRRGSCDSSAIRCAASGVINNSVPPVISSATTAPIVKSTSAPNADRSVTTSPASCAAQRGRPGAHHDRGRRQHRGHVLAHQRRR